MDTTTLALIGVVILVAALLSGLVERTRFPQVALFLLLGLILGPLGLGLVRFELDSQILRTIATSATFRQSSAGTPTSALPTATHPGKS